MKSSVLGVVLGVTVGALLTQATVALPPRMRAVRLAFTRTSTPTWLVLAWTAQNTVQHVIHWSNKPALWGADPLNQLELAAGICGSWGLGLRLWVDGQCKRDVIAIAQRLRRGCV